MTDRERFEQGLVDAQEAEQESLLPKRDRLETVSVLIRQCEAEATSLVQALKVSPDGIVGETLQQDINAVNKRHAALTKEHENLLGELEREQLTDEDIAAALAFREAVIVGLQNPTFEDKRRTLEDLRVEIQIRDRQHAEVRCRLPRAATVITFGTSKQD